MKIYFIGQKGIPAKSGGVEKHVEELSTRLAMAGNEVYVYTRPNYTDKNLEEHKGVKLISLPSIPTKNLDAISHTFFACLDLIRRDVDIIHFHSIGPSSLIWLAKILKPGASVVATFHCQDYFHKKWGGPARWYLQFGEKVCCKLADKTIAVSKGLRDYARKKYKSEAVYIPNGVTIIKEEGEDSLKKWNLGKGEYILAVSRLVKHKGLHYLIEAFKNIKTDKKLVIVGSAACTEEYENYLKTIASTDERIIFTGSQCGRTLHQLFANCSLFVQPSESEGMSIALLEAMSFGKAVLVSDIPENLEVLADGNYIFKNKNVSDLRLELDRLIDKSELLLESGAKNRARVEKHYNWEEITKETQDVYRDIRNSENLLFQLKRKIINI